MSLRALFLAGIPAAVLLATACGGGGGANETQVPATQEAGGQTTAVEPAGAGMGELPAPGEARIEVDGQSFSGEIHQCEVGEANFLVGATTEVDGAPYNFGVTAFRPGSSWSGQAGLTPSTVGPTYLSSNGSVTVDGASVVYVGEFSKNEGSDSESVGEGRLAATCP